MRGGERGEGGAGPATWRDLQQGRSKFLLYSIVQLGHTPTRFGEESFGPVAKGLESAAYVR